MKVGADKVMFGVTGRTKVDTTNSFENYVRFCNCYVSLTVSVSANQMVLQGRQGNFLVLMKGVVQDHVMNHLQILELQ